LQSSQLQLGKSNLTQTLNISVLHESLFS